MSASLVGSEMCIRDSLSAATARRIRGAPLAALALPLGLEGPLEKGERGLDLLEVRGVLAVRIG
eukprot:12767051-Alexandrium_andersonii.AAC.1